MLSSSDIWYGLRKKETEELDEVDKMILRKILDAPSSTCVESISGAGPNSYPHHYKISKD